MLEPPIPEQENLRLATLRNLDVLDSPAEEGYDRLTRIAKKLFDVPIVVVSLVDSKRQWFKSKIGVDAEELPRRTSFCGHAILQKHAFVVNDTRNDPRFVDNPLVTGQPFIRFYAAQPLQATNGMMIGTLCIIDDKPREFEAEDVYLLKDLAVQVEMVLNNPDLQRMTTSLMKSEKRLLETIYLLEKKEQRERANKRCLEMISRGEPLLATLEAVIIGVEQQSRDFLGCILTIDLENNCLIVSAAPNMPEQYIDALQGMPIQEGIDSCEASISEGNAINPQKPITHPYWSKFSILARTANFSSAWSQPIKDSKGGMLGILVICSQELGHPDAADSLLIEEFADLSAIAIERARTDTLIKNQALFDPLTHLPNRKMLLDRLEQEMLKANRTDSRVAFLFIDLDHFKEINDTLGHHKGDLLLIEVATRLQKCVRVIDTVARFGGDEFAVLMGEIVDSDSVERVANKILAAISQSFDLDGDLACLSASVGIAFYPDNATDMDKLINNADQAMYEAKNKGRNRFQYFPSSLQEHALERVSLLMDLRAAVSGNQLLINYQPVIDLNDGRVARAGALLCWQHPQQGLIAPRYFLPLVEDSGLILEIGEWFFTRILQQLKVWHTQLTKQFHVSINTSALQFRENSSGLKSLAHQLSAMDLPANSLGIEIAASLMAEKRIDVEGLLASIHKSGITIALDDFGSGCTPLRKLQDFQIDYLKIDKALIQRIDVDIKARQLCEATILMAQKMGIKVVAKGVVNELQHKLLIDAGCNYAQGNLFSSAVSAEKFPFSIYSGK